MRPERIWLLSIRAFRTGHRRTANLLKLVNYLLFKTVLPFECRVAEDVVLMHRGLGVVVHPNTSIGRDVVINHGVVIGAGSNGLDSETRVTIEAGCRIGANASVVSAWGRSLTLGRNCFVGAGVTVYRDVAPDTKLIAPQPVAEPRWRRRPPSAL